MTLNSQSVSLTPTMKRHLRELQDIAQKDTYGNAYWYPTGAEWRTAEAMERRGWLHRLYGNGIGGAAFNLTDAGRRVSV